MPKSSAEFGDITPEAVEHCLDYGASKIAGFMSKLALGDLLSGRFPYPADQEIPDFKLLRLQEIFNLGQLPAVKVGTATAYSNGPERQGYHYDSNVVAGLSFVAPINGPRANFKVLDPSDRSTILYETEYGQSDLMMVREGISSYNGVPLFRTQAFHGADFDAPRLLAFIDTNSRDLRADFTQ